MSKISMGAALTAFVKGYPCIRMNSNDAGIYEQRDFDTSSWMSIHKLFYSMCIGRNLWEDAIRDERPCLYANHARQCG